MRISVVIPSRNDGSSLGSTIKSIVSSACCRANLEVVVVDDASRISVQLEQLKQVFNVKLVRSREHLGVPRSRNLGARLATGDVLFMTDSHCVMSEGWDDRVRQDISRKKVLSATIADNRSSFRGYGCRLVVPFMGTHWNRDRLRRGTEVQVASCAGTAITRELFFRLGGYDEGMIFYGAAEPEFSVRVWLSGAKIVSVPDLFVFHRFKTRSKRNHFLRLHRTFMVHNSLRFGFLYLSEPACLQMLRHFVIQFPYHFRHALALIQKSDVWRRRKELANTLPRCFDWFVSHFLLKDQIGNPILK